MFGLSSGVSLAGTSAVQDVYEEWGIASTPENLILDDDQDWQAYYWGHANDPIENNTNTIWFKKGHVITGGVYGTNTIDDVLTDVGGYGNSGRFVFHRLYLESTMVDAKTWVNAAGETLPQTGAVYWLNCLYATADAATDITELRMTQDLRNVSPSFKVQRFYGKDGISIANAGLMEFENAYLGLTNDFTNRTLGETDAMLTLTYNDAATGSVKNSGTFRVTGNLVSYIPLSETDTTASWEFGNWENHAQADLTAVTVGSLDNKVGTINVTTYNGTNFANAGTVNAGTLNAGSGTNTGTVKVANVFSGTLASSGTFTFDGTLGAQMTGGTLTNTGTLSATEKLTIAAGELIQNSATAMNLTALDLTGGKLSVASGRSTALSSALTLNSGSIANEGTLTYSSAHIAAGTVTGAGTLGTSSAALTVDAGATVTQGTVRGIITNSGTINASVELASAGDWTNNGTINAGKMSAGALTNAAGKNITTTGALTASGLFTNYGTAHFNSAAFNGGLTNAAGAELTLDTNTGLTADATNAGKITAAANLRFAALDNQGQIFSESGLLTLGNTLNSGSFTGKNAKFTSTFQNSVGGSFTMAYSLTASDSVTNSGTFSAGSGTFSGTVVNYAGGSFTLTGNTTLESVQSTFAGSVTNLAGMTLNESVFGTEATEAATATLTNQGSGTLTVNGNVTAYGTLTNAGTMTANAGSVVNLTSSGSTTFSGTLTASGTSEISAGTLKANTFNLGTVNLTGGTLKSDSTMGSHSFGALTNAGNVILKSTATAASLDNKAAGSLSGTNVAFTGGLTNAGSTSLTGDLIVGGALTNSGSITAAGSVTLNGVTTQTSQAKMTNNAGSLVASGGLSGFSSLTANQKVTTSGTGGIITAYNNAADITFKAGYENLSPLAQTNIDGVMTASGAYSFGTMTVEGGLVNKGILYGDRGLTLKGSDMSSEGFLTSMASVTVNGTLTNSGYLCGGLGVDANDGSTITSVSNVPLVTIAGGKTTNTATATFRTDELNIAAGAEFADESTTSVIGKISGSGTFSNKAALALSKLETGTGFVYNQSGGSLTTADGSFFSGSTLNISGGTLSRLAEGFNTLGSGNTVNLSGTSNPDYAGAGNNPMGSGWKSGLTVVSVGELNSDSSVTVGTGSLLEADVMNLTSKTLTINGGAVSTKLTNLFDTVVDSIYTMDSGSGTQIATKVIGANNVQGVSSAFRNNLTIGAEGATLVVTDDVVSLRAIASAASQLSALGGGKTTNVVFTGNAASGINVSDTIYYEDVQALKNEQTALGSSAFLDPGVVFSTMTYANQDHAGGTTDTEFNLSNLKIGFKNIRHAETVTITGGSALALVGDTASQIELLETANATVSVSGANSTFKLGTEGVSGTKGHVGSVNVSESGIFKTTGGGTYKVDAVTLSGGAKVSVDAGATLSADAMTDASGVEISNSGTLTAGNSAIAGIWTNAGTLVSTATQLAAGSKFTTKASGGSTFSNAVTVAGKVNNEAGGTITFENGLTVTNGVTTAADKYFSNQGSVIAKGTNTLAGAVSLEAGSRTVASGSTTVTTTGNVKNAGDSRYNALKLNGRYTVSNDALIYATDFSTSASSRIMLGANSVILADDLSIAGGVAYTYNPEDTLNSATLVVGTNNITRTLQTYEAIKNRVTALEAGTDMVTSLALDVSPMAMSGVRAAAFANEEPVRVFDIDKTAGWGYVYQGAEGVTNAIQSSYGGDNGTSLVNKNVEFVTANDRSGAFFGEGNVYLAEGSTLAFGDGTVMDVRDTVHTDTGTVDQANMIVRGILTGDAGSALKVTNLVLDGIGSVTVGGTHEGDFLHMTDNGVYRVEGGSSIIKGAKLEGGSVTVASGVMGFGEFLKPDGSAMTAAELSEEAKTLSTRNAVLWLDNTAVNVSGSSLQIGSLGEGDAVRSGDVYFGADSAFIVNAKTVSDNFKFVNGTTGRFTVKNGSELIVTSASWGRNFILADGFDEISLEEGAWQGESLINKSALANAAMRTAVSDDGSKLYLLVGTAPAEAPDTPEEPEEPTVPDTPAEDLPADSNESGNTESGSNAGSGTPPDGGSGSDSGSGSGSGSDNGTGSGSGSGTTSGSNAGSNGGSGSSSLPYYDFATILPDAVGSKLINPIINEDPFINAFDSDDVAVRFMTRAVNPDFGGDPVMQGHVINSVFGLEAASGVRAYELERSTNFMDAVDGHLSMGEGQNGTGGLWVKTAYEKSRTDSIKLGRSTFTGYEADTKGFYFGADALLGSDLRLGTVMSYAKGDIDSRGPLMKTSTDAEVFGVSAYAAKRFGSASLIGQIGVQSSRGEISQNMAAAMQLDGVKADTKSLSYLFGLRGEYELGSENFTVTPHAGVRLIHTTYDGTDVRIGHETAFRIESDDSTVVQFPVGFSMKGSLNQSGFDVKPRFDLTAVIQTGDTKTDAAVKAAGGLLHASDTVTSEIGGDVFARMLLGLDVTRGNFSFGLSCAGTKGQNGQEAFSADASLKWHF